MKARCDGCGNQKQYVETAFEGSRILFCALCRTLREHNKKVLAREPWTPYGRAIVSRNYRG